jgi:hypothetical protein
LSFNARFVITSFNARFVSSRNRDIVLNILKNPRFYVGTARRGGDGVTPATFPTILTIRRSSDGDFASSSSPSSSLPSGSF